MALKLFYVRAGGREIGYFVARNLRVARRRLKPVIERLRHPSIIRCPRRVVLWSWDAQRVVEISRAEAEGTLCQFPGWMQE